MSRNDAMDFAQRLYARIPAQYRVYDADRGRPLYALLLVVGAQAANLRQDLDALWDNFFIETCDDWVVPYIGDLMGTNLLQHPIGQGNRLEVRNTVLWRRTKGTPSMLRALTQSVSGWPAELAEFFFSLGWSQNLNHVRLDRSLTPDLRDPLQLGLLGRASDPFAHSADFKPASALDQAPVKINSLGVGVSGWGTPGRHQLKNLGLFVRRLQTFPVQGVTPASARPGATAASPVMFTFDPLFRDVPLFTMDTAVPIRRTDLAADTWNYFGQETDIAVRQFGVLVGADQPPSVPSVIPSRNPFTFGALLTRVLGASKPGIFLDPATGMQLMNPRSFQLGTAHFLITAEWLPTSGAAAITLGFLSTLLAVSNGPAPLPSGAAFVGQATVSVPGQLVITVETGHRTPVVNIPASPAARFPGAVIAVRTLSANTWGGPLHSSDGVYVYLPSAFVMPGKSQTYYVADDGSTWTTAVVPPVLANAALARASEGRIYPARSDVPSSRPADAFIMLNRSAGAMRLADGSRFGLNGNAALISVQVEADLFTAPGLTPLPLATMNSPGITSTPSGGALSGTIPNNGILSLLIHSASLFIPPMEIVIMNRAGLSLMVYTPELSRVNTQDVRLLVADDGSTYFAPDISDTVTQANILQQHSFTGLLLARAAQGQSLSIPGLWPLQQRAPIALDLCRSERASLINPGELGIDPELGHFALSPQDPALLQGGFTVDYVEALSDFVGAVNSSSRQPTTAATRLVAQSGDANSPLTQTFTGAPVYTSLAAAIAAAVNGDVIEITDSATYSASAALAIPASLPAAGVVQNLTIRAAAGRRPCLTSYQNLAGVISPTLASLMVTGPMTALTLEGLLISGGPLLIQSTLTQLQMTACTLDPGSTASASLMTTDNNLNSNAGYVLSRCVIGGLQIGAGVAQLTIADSIVDRRGGIAICGIQASPPVSPPPFAAGVQLERVTVFGSIFCTVLNASESLLNDLATVLNQQQGCVRFTRFEPGSLLPRRYRCVPTDAQIAATPSGFRTVVPVFNSRRFGRPDYAQPATAGPLTLITAGENGSEIGAFAGAQNTNRLLNLNLKLQEFMPAGLSAVLVAES